MNTLFIAVYRNGRKLKRGKQFYICHTQLNSPIVKLKFLPREKTRIRVEYKYEY